MMWDKATEIMNPYEALKNAASDPKKGKIKVKTKVKNYVLFHILTFMAALGFALTYSVVWIFLGLPINWWSAIVPAVLGALSVRGLLEWMVKGAEIATAAPRNDKDGKPRADAGQCDRG